MGKRIAIIGGGPAGLAAAKAIGLEPSAKEKFSKVDLYERHSNVGGLWTYTGNKDLVRAQVPSTTNENSGEILSANARTAEERFVSPMYENMETNIPKDIMQFRDFPMPEEYEPFPTRGEIADYVRSYARTVPPNVNLFYNKNVVSLTKKDNEWELIYQDLNNRDNEIKRKYDDVVLAQGHFDSPYIPDVPGLKEWYKQDSESITHSKYFNNVKPFKGKNVLIIGNSASGLDIATQCITYAKSVTMSSKSESPFKDVIISDVGQIGVVAKYDINDNRSVTTVKGEKISDVDVVIFCTGYLYKIPFLKSYQGGKTGLTGTGSQFRYLYKQLFYIPDPTLSTMLVPQKIIPFPFAECQAQYIARVLSGRVSLPSKDIMLKEYESELAEKGEGNSFHVMPGTADCEYCNTLFKEIEGTDKDGFVAEFWNEKRTERRAHIVDYKSKRLQLIVKYAEKLQKEEHPYVLLRGEFNP